MKNVLSGVCFALAIFFFVKAHSVSDYSVGRKKPNSLVYYEDKDLNKAYWLTYDEQIDEWTKKNLGENPEKAEKYMDGAAYSKYGVPYTFGFETEVKKIQDFDVILQEDTILNSLRNVRLTIIPKRNVNKIDLYSNNDIVFHSLEFNGKKAAIGDSSKLYRGTKNSALINYYVSKGDSLEVKFTVEKGIRISVKVLEYSFDLLENPKFSIEPRLEYMMPKPFVITDAIAVKRTFVIDSLKLKKDHRNLMEANSQIILENE